MFSGYSKEPGESGGSAGCLVRYSTYSTYSKEPGESGCSVGCRACVASLPRHLPGVDASVRAACCMVFAWFLHGFCMTCGTACFLQHVEQLVFCMVLA